MGRCGRQNMLRPYLKIWEWIFDRAVKAISSLGVRSPCLGPCIAESKGVLLLSNTLIEFYFKQQNYFDNPLRLHKTLLLSSGETFIRKSSYKYTRQLTRLSVSTKANFTFLFFESPLVRNHLCMRS